MPVNQSDNYGQWSDLPIKYDSLFLCTHCNCITLHNCTAYKDIEYRVCTKCHERTDWLPNGSRQLRLESARHSDSWKPDFDFKRNNPRKYKPRNKEP